MYSGGIDHWSPQCLGPSSDLIAMDFHLFLSSTCIELMEGKNEWDICSTAIQVWV